MTVDNYINIIQTFGFPIAMCCALMWYIYQIEKKHKEEIDKLSEAIQNNTIVMTQILDKISHEI